MKIYFGTVNRGAPVREGGVVGCLDWASKKMVAKEPVYPEDPPVDDDPNPRGNARGCRGIEVVDDHIITANYHTLEIRDSALNLNRTVTNGLMVALHEIALRSATSIWVTSTAIDAALSVDLNSGKITESYWPREAREFQEYLRITPLEIDKNKDNRKEFLAPTQFKGESHLHLNAVCEKGGELFAVFNHCGVLANLTRRRVVVQKDNLRGAHNLVIDEEGIAYINDTRRCRVRRFDLDSGAELAGVDLFRYPGVVELLVSGVGAALLRKVHKPWTRNLARPLFVRGLDKVGDFLWVGISPATILLVDLNRRKVVDHFVYSRDIRVCIHGLKAVEETGPA